MVLSFMVFQSNVGSLDMKHSCINLAARLIYSSRFHKLLQMIKRDNIVVLMYHGVVNDDDHNASEDWLQVRESDFRMQMEYIKNNYEPVFLEDIWSNTSKNKIAITFDDGYRNNYKYAFPILQELSIPATIFVATSMIDSNKFFWYDMLRASLKFFGESREDIRAIITACKKLHPKDIDGYIDSYLEEKYPDWKSSFLRSCDISDTYGTLKSEEMKEMEESGLVRFGSHTHGHEIITQLEMCAVEQTISTSLSTLKSMGIAPSSVFCFPNGEYKPEHIDILKKMNLSGAVTTQKGMYKKYNNPFKIPRVGVGRHYSLPLFVSLMSLM